MKKAFAVRFSVLCVAALCLAGFGVGVPAVMAAAGSGPGAGDATGAGVTSATGAGVTSATGAGAGVPADWPAAKASAMQAENQMRAAATGRPVVAPAGTEVSGTGVSGEGASGTGAAGSGPEPQSAAVSAAESAPRAAYTAGILPLTSGGPFNSSQFLGTNLWNGPVRGHWEVVQAGGVPLDKALGAASPTQAGVFVSTQSADPSAATAPVVRGVLAPSAAPAGTFTVKSVTGDILTLTVSGSSTLYHFDVVARRFVG